MSQDWWIVRSDEHGGPEISLPEWEAVADQDPYLVRSVNGRRGEYTCTLVAGSWMHWNGGTIQSKNATQPIRARMVALAEQLGGWVEDDDGGKYDEHGRLASDTAGQPPGIMSRIGGAVLFLYVKLRAR